GTSGPGHRGKPRHRRRHGQAGRRTRLPCRRELRQPWRCRRRGGPPDSSAGPQGHGRAGGRRRRKAGPGDVPAGGQPAGPAHRAGQQRGRRRCGDPGRSHDRRAPATHVRDQRDRLHAVRPGGRAPHGHEPWRLGRRHRQPVQCGRAPGCAGAVRRLRRRQGRHRCIHHRAGQGSGRRWHPRQRGAARPDRNRDPCFGRTAGPGSPIGPPGADATRWHSRRGGGGDRMAAVAASQLHHHEPGRCVGRPL
ncbi:MAG: Short-chain dehydrogenase, partial [uncultured Ramlibacter sp.]